MAGKADSGSQSESGQSVAVVEKARQQLSSMVTGVGVCVCVQLGLLASWHLSDIESRHMIKRYSPGFHLSWFPPFPFQFETPAQRVPLPTFRVDLPS